jgi:two-component sensor histidine kinase
MATTAELARYYTTLDAPGVDHLQRLVASWGLLADLCFADLLLFARVDPARKVPGVAEEAEGAAERLVVLGQVRPLTSQTLFRSDWMGDVIAVDERPMVMRALRLGEMIESELVHPSLREQVRVQCIPVRHEGRTIAVMTRESTPTVGRHQGELERAYIEVFNRLVRMIAAGQFPFAGEEGLGEEAPRVGDGAIILDDAARVEYASPNAISALHRVGVHANAEGMRLSELGLQENVVRTSFAKAFPATEEVERGPEVTVLVRCLPLLENDGSAAGPPTVTGAVVLVRDISELRRRDRLLMSKDATIREIHHRVKNNLQTISSLLRLQARRLSSPEAKAALEESVRRIRSIALVHETLSHEAGDDVPFVEIVRPLVRMVEEGLISPEHPVRFKVIGDAGKLPATIATPLAVVLTELLQNVVDHAYPPGIDSFDGHVTLQLDNDGRELRVTVTDDGAGLPDGFAIEATTGLGLSIVRTLVTTELNGTIDMARGEGPGIRPGTVVALRIPLSAEQPAEPRDPPLRNEADGRDGPGGPVGPPTRTDTTGRPDGRGAHLPTAGSVHRDAQRPPEGGGR